MAKKEVSKTSIVFPVSTMIMIEHGEWDDYNKAGPFTVLKELGIDHCTEQFLASNKYDDPSLFIEWLQEMGYIKEMDIITWSMGKYHIDNNHIHIP